MGVSFNINPTSSAPETHTKKHKFLLVCNYILLAAASSFIFLTLSLRLFPSLCGFFLILLHVLTILIAVFACTVATSGSGKWYATHMVATVLTAIFQGSISVLIFASTTDFLGYLKSYVREEDGAIILRMAGCLSVLIFFLEWVVLALTFLLRYHAFVSSSAANGGGYGGRFQEEDPKGWSRPFQVYA
ncbi:Transmembrane protein [Melia azedarach]|uniref:Transmembrane protein n=1 Tax=Melia azedarach TaxID=155640 RepID=A0ACC1YJ12_MELAZ|nr:Transmembrane protein [Melia azedarach]